MGGYRNPTDILGQTFYKLKVLEISDKTNKYNHTFYKCQCECGDIRVIRRNSLVSGSTKTCGKCFVPKNLTNQKFGKLTVIKLLKKENEKNIWLCECDCGKYKEINTSILLKGIVKNCGCDKKLIPYGKNHNNWGGYEDISQRYWKTVKRGAKERNIEFNTTIEYVWNLFIKQEGVCALTGQKLQFATRIYTDQTASLDRIDSNKGYIENNLQWVHKDLNKMKLNKSDEEFIEICKMVVMYRGGSKCS